MDDKKVTVSVSNRTIVRALVLIVVAILGYKFIGRISHVLTLIFAAGFLSLALNPIVAWLRRGMKIKSRVKATALAYLMVVLFLVLFALLVVPPLVRESRDFITTVPQTVENFQTQDSSLSRTVKRYHLDEKLVQGAKDFSANYGGYGSKLLDTGKRVGEALASILAVLVLTFMMLVEGPKWLEAYFKALPNKRRERHYKLLSRMYKSVTGFVNGQVILAAIAGFFAFVALQVAGHIIGVQTNSIALAGIVAVLGIIPLFGNPIAATIVVTFSMLNSVTLGVAMAIYFAIYYFIENHTLQPILQSKLNELTALMVFIAALIGIGFGGILGAIIAIPVASSIKILVEDHLERKGLKPVKTEDLDS
jgi:predicted PurR-regulated permease PerM